MVSQTRENIAKFLEDRGFCPTGKGGGTDNSCSSKDGGGGGGEGGEGGGGTARSKYTPSKGYTKSSGPVSGEDRNKALKILDKSLPRATTTDGFGKSTFVGDARGTKASVLKNLGADLKKDGWDVDHNKAKGKLIAYKADKKSGLVHRIEFKVPKKLSKEDKAEKIPGQAMFQGKVRPPLIMPKGGNRGGRKGKRSLDMGKVETRSISMQDDDSFPILAVETRCAGDGMPDEKWVVGYAARFGVSSLKMNDFYERIDPNAFSIVTERRGRKSALETRALFNHDPNHILGRFPNTLRMTVDEQGLRYEIKMPESRSDIVEAIQRGDIRGSSFSFILSPGGDEWSVEEGRSIRTVKSVAALVDVGPVTYPAYPDASVTVAKRSYDRFVASREKMSKKQVALKRKSDDLREYLRSHGR